MARKVIAAIMDVVHVKYFPEYKQHAITKIKKCFVYDPKIVAPKLDNKKEVDI